MGFGNVCANTDAEKIFSICTMLIGGEARPRYSQGALEIQACATGKLRLGESKVPTQVHMVTCSFIDLSPLHVTVRINRCDLFQEGRHPES